MKFQALVKRGYPGAIALLVVATTACSGDALPSPTSTVTAQPTLATTATPATPDELYRSYLERVDGTVFEMWYAIDTPQLKGVVRIYKQGTERHRVDAIRLDGDLVVIDLSYIVTPDREVFCLGPLGDQVIDNPPIPMNSCIDINGLDRDARPSFDANTVLDWFRKPLRLVTGSSRRTILEREVDCFTGTYGVEDDLAAEVCFSQSAWPLSAVSGESSITAVQARTLLITNPFDPPYALVEP